VAELYRSGLSLAVLGEHVGVNPTIVRTALVRAGVAMRGSHMALVWAVRHSLPVEPCRRGETVPTQSR
jgi:hypothetical protein